MLTPYYSKGKNAVPVLSLAIVVLIIGAAWFYLGRRTALLLRTREATKLHSLPHYYGFFVALTAMLPAYALLIVMAIGDDLVFANLMIDYPGFVE